MPDSNRLLPNLTTRSLIPENQETPIHFLRSVLTPESYHFRRNHFPYPELPNPFLLSVRGTVLRPLELRAEQLSAWKAKSVTVALECSGNKRKKFSPEVFGEQWEDGAISQSEWTGVPLADILHLAGLQAGSQEVVFIGADRGHHPGVKGVIPFARSLSVKEALHPDVLVAYQCNGQAIPYRNGYPLRLIVPHWYGMASVKWLQDIEVIDHAFQGPFQTKDYQYYPSIHHDGGKHPVTTKHVNSIIQMPMDLSVLPVGVYVVEGIAWSGTGAVEQVELSLNQGKSWSAASLTPDPSRPYAWVRWTYTWHAEQPGQYEIWSRATDAAGHTQPLEPFWNRKGYGHHAIYRTRIQIE
ncbi:sulfite oxidase [Tumebacillus sp. DT12]|uniref:Sulfite oxidase n=1 Tax=Tumebacillus lacus TaxID=2995335 RepID=A0ABT3X1H9_9BACL|nr:sulfite oxidase [Tumebacillus lacus]MCX7569828.1 sulfite oxidase [Tumebacillus lacus]